MKIMNAAECRAVVSDVDPTSVRADQDVSVHVLFILRMFCSCLQLLRARGKQTVALALQHWAT